MARLFGRTGCRRPRERERVETAVTVHDGQGQAYRGPNYECRDRGPQTAGFEVLAGECRSQRCPGYPMATLEAAAGSQMIIRGEGKAEREECKIEWVEIGHPVWVKFNLIVLFNKEVSLPGWLD